MHLLLRVPLLPVPASTPVNRRLACRAGVRNPSKPMGATEGDAHQVKQPPRPPLPQAVDGAADTGAGKEVEFRLVGYSKFVRINPRSDRFRVRSFHHVEFWCADATNTSRRFSFGLGMPLAARSDLSTGNPVHASYLLQSGDLRFLFSAPYSSSPAALATVLPDCKGLSPSAAAIPSFDAPACRRFFNVHGLGVRAVALLVDDAAHAFNVSVAHGARPSFPPAVLGCGGAVLSEVELYGNVVLRYVSVSGDKGKSKSWSFLPGFEDVEPPSPPLDYGIRRLDHAVGNVPELAAAVEYVRGFTGFHQFAEFAADDVGTTESGLNSAVLANNDENVLIPMNEPVHGTRRRSQIQTYLDHNEGPGVQHLALATSDVLATLRRMRAASAWGGFEFLQPPPPTYYRNLRQRVADVLTEEQMAACEELGVLVDRDDQGVLLQIFTKPVGDRPTIFLEIIQRIGCMVKDEGGREYQKGGCGGFGKGNFSALFKSIEEYEKSLEAKQATTPSPSLSPAAGASA